MVPARLFEAMIEEMGDRDLVALARERLARKDTAVEVNIDEIQTASGGVPTQIPAGSAR